MALDFIKLLRQTLFVEEIGFWTILGYVIAAGIVALAKSNADSIDLINGKKLSQMQNRINSLIEDYSSLEAKRNDLVRKNEKLGELIYNYKKSDNLQRKMLGEFDSVIEEKSIFFPSLLAARLYAFDAITEIQKQTFLSKMRPSWVSADKLQLIRKDAREQLRLLHRLEFRLRYLESLFPWLADFSDEDISSLMEDTDRQVGAVAEFDSEDPIYESNLISREEGQKLSTAERNQLALDRWLKNRNKSAWQIGREFERFYGYQMESKGFSVQYHGALDGLEDLGRDLVAQKGEKTLIIQCKYWAKHKTIHEKHIYQLYGTWCDYIISKNLMPKSRQGELFSERDILKKVVPKFVSTAKLSDRAKLAAEMLQVEVEIIENVEMNYPRIKCNISSTGEKIYHLPIDQQYDKVKIEPKKGELYAMACKVAEEKGFRRAWKWRPDA